MKQTIQKNAKILICGLIIGFSAIVPGLSGGALAVSLGIYPLLIGSVLHLRKEFRKSLGFLIPFGLTAAIGMLLFGVVMKPLLANYEHSITWLFLGLITGSIPAFLQEANEKGFRPMYLLPMAITLGLGLVLSMVTGYQLGVSATSPLMMFLGGGILAIGTVVPGISSSFIMMQMGIYDDVISAFVSMEAVPMLWVALGAVVFFLLIIRVVNFAFQKFHGYAHFAAFGFLLSSMVGVFPGVGHVTDILLFLLGAAILYFFQKFTKKKIA